MNFATHENSGESKAIELPRVDLVLLAIKDEELHVLLRRRDGREFFGELALPGGIIEVESDASLDHTVQRVARRLLQRQLPNFRQVTTIGNANRDPRKKWSLTVVYQSLVRSDFVFPDQMAAKQLSWHPVEKIRAGEKLNLDHKDLICLATDQAIRHHRHEIESLRFPNGWVPREFTLFELH